MTTIALGLLLLIVMMTWVNTRAPQNTTRFALQPSWEQDFTASQTNIIDPSIWHYSTDPNVPSYNNEKQAYTTSPKNVRIEPGTGLIIEAHKEKYIYPSDPTKNAFDYTSGRIDTSQSLNFEYGKIEATIKLPPGQGVWPAFWLLSANNVHTDKVDKTAGIRSDPRFYMKDGEIDIMEYYGSPEGRVEATVHTYDDSIEKTITVADASDSFHTYAVEIEPSKITWTIDNKAVFAYDKTSNNPDVWPFGKGNQFYIILNLAMGGSGGGQIDDDQAPWRMEVKNVKYYPFNK